jgi:hypothetical protein
MMKQIAPAAALCALAGCAVSPELVEAILQDRQPVALTATRLTELDPPLDRTEQHKLLAS